MRDEVIEFSTSVIQYVDGLDELIDSYYNDIKDITETDGDFIKPVKAIFSIYMLAHKRKFKAFLKSIHAIRSDDQPETWPAFRSLTFDDENRLWVSTISDDQENYEWWVLDEAGEATYHLSTESR